MREPIHLRDYQRDFIEQIEEALVHHRSICAVLATGGGKSVVFRYLTEKSVDQGERVLIIVHREELLDQAIEHVKRSGIFPGKIKGSGVFHPCFPVQVASIQTLAKPKRLEYLLARGWVPNKIFFDEAHHIEAKTWQAPLDFFKESKIVGFTATPCRLDGKGFENTFETLVLGKSTKWLIENGYLSRYTYYSKPLLHRENLHTRAGDFDTKELRESLDQDVVIADALAQWRDKALGKKTICFAVDRAHSIHIVDQYNAFGQQFYGRDIAVHVDSKLNKIDRKQAIERFRNDPYCFILSNVGIVSEGFDLPEIECTQILRASKSLVFHLQSIGRCLRIIPGEPGKEAIILDHVGNVLEHGLPDAEHRWSLSGVLKAVSHELSCPMCGYIHLKENVRDGMPCEGKCGYVFDFTKLNQEKRERSQKTIICDEDLNLEVFANSDFFRVFLKYKKKADKYGYKPLWAFYKWRDEFLERDIEIPFRAFKEIEEHLDMNRWAIRAYAEYLKEWGVG